MSVNTLTKTYRTKKKHRVIRGLVLRSKKNPTNKKKYNEDLILTR